MIGCSNRYLYIGILNAIGNVRKAELDEHSQGNDPHMRGDWMIGRIEDYLDACWQDDGQSSKTCRWCQLNEPGQHAEDCPCLALSLALQQRDSLVDYIKALKRNMTMQGAIRLAKKSARSEMKARVDESTLRLEAALARLRELGIDEMLR